VKVITLTCPRHGVLVEWDEPGPANPPGECWKPGPRTPNAFVCPPPTCRETLILSERDEDGTPNLTVVT